MKKHIIALSLLVTCLSAGSCLHAMGEEELTAIRNEHLRKDFRRVSKNYFGRKECRDLIDKAAEQDVEYREKQLEINQDWNERLESNSLDEDSFAETLFDKFQERQRLTEKYRKDSLLLEKEMVEKYCR